MTVPIKDPGVKYLYNRLKEIRSVVNLGGLIWVDSEVGANRLNKVYEIAQRAIERIDGGSY